MDEAKPNKGYVQGLLCVSTSFVVMSNFQRASMSMNVVYIGGGGSRTYAPTHAPRNIFAVERNIRTHLWRRRSAGGTCK